MLSAACARCYEQRDCIVNTGSAACRSRSVSNWRWPALTQMRTADGARLESEALHCLSHTVRTRRADERLAKPPRRVQKTPRCATCRTS